MYEQFFNFMGLRENPFHVSPDPRFYYPTTAQESALTELLYGIQTRQGLMVLTGEAGTGKTHLLNQILDWLRRLGRSNAYIFHAHLEPIGLLRLILSDFGVPCQSKSKSELVKALHGWLLQRHAAQDLPVLILDEAQGLPLRTLDEIRLLLNLETPRGKLLQIIFSGQPELDDKLRLPALRHLRQRIMIHSRLPLLTQKETAAYISSRLAVAGCSNSSLFPDEAVEDIYESSHGIPRVVNVLCEHAIISAYAERQRVVSPEMIQRIAMDFDLIAKPMAVADAEPRPSDARLAPFPVIETIAAPSVAKPRFTECCWEQIEFDIFKDLPDAIWKGTQPALGEDPAPAVPPPVLREFPKPAAGSVRPTPPDESSGIAKYRRKHRSRSAVAVFARNSIASIHRVWHALTHLVVRETQSALGEDPAPGVPPPALREFPKPVAGPICPAAPNRFSGIAKYWRKYRSRSAVAVFARNSIASIHRVWHALTHLVVRETQSALGEDPAPGVPPPALRESPKPVAGPICPAAPNRFSGIAKYWRKYRSRSAVAVFARNSIASIHRVWHALIYPVVRYARSVSHSFVRDCRLLSNSVTVTTPAVRFASPANGAKSTNGRKVLAPIVGWLRKPITPANISSNRSPARSAHRK